MKTRRHHNNTGYRQIKRGKTVEQVAAMARRVFGFKRKPSEVGQPVETGKKLGAGSLKEHAH